MDLNSVDTQHADTKIETSTENTNISNRAAVEDNEKMDGTECHQEIQESTVHKNIFNERPASRQAKFECVCGAKRFHSGRKLRDLHPVQCVSCHLWQHAECVQYDLTDPHRGEFKCPHCHVASVSLIVDH